MKATALIQPFTLVLVLPYFILDLKQRLLRVGVELIPLRVVPCGLPLLCIQHQLRLLLLLRLRRRCGQLLLLLGLLEVKLERRRRLRRRLSLRRRRSLKRVLRRWGLKRILLRWRLERILLRRRGEGERHCRGWRRGSSPARAARGAGDKGTRRSRRKIGRAHV